MFLFTHTHRISMRHRILMRRTSAVDYKLQQSSLRMICYFLLAGLYVHSRVDLSGILVSLYSSLVIPREPPSSGLLRSPWFLSLFVGHLLTKFIPSHNRIYTRASPASFPAHSQAIHLHYTVERHSLCHAPRVPRTIHTYPQYTRTICVELNTMLR